MMIQKFVLLSFAVVLIMPAGGCNDGPAVYEVVGSASYQGNPLAEGLIIFAPRDGIGPTATGDIRDGRFSVFATAGEKTVRITASKETGRMIQGAMDQQYPERIDIVPPQYNTASTLVRNIDPDGSRVIDFQLE